MAYSIQHNSQTHHLKTVNDRWWNLVEQNIQNNRLREVPSNTEVICRHIKEVKVPDFFELAVNEQDFVFQRVKLEHTLDC